MGSKTSVNLILFFNRRFFSVKSDRRKLHYWKRSFCFISTLKCHNFMLYWSVRLWIRPPTKIQIRMCPTRKNRIQIRPWKYYPKFTAVDPLGVLVDPILEQWAEAADRTLVQSLIWSLSLTFGSTWDVFSSVQYEIVAVSIFLRFRHIVYVSILKVTLDHKN